MIDCVVQGCESKWTLATVDFYAHIIRVHQECDCGWVGVQFGSHIAQLKRHGVWLTSTHKVVETYPYAPHRMAALAETPFLQEGLRAYLASHR